MYELCDLCRRIAQMTPLLQPAPTQPLPSNLLSLLSPYFLHLAVVARTLKFADFNFMAIIKITQDLTLFPLYFRILYYYVNSNHFILLNSGSVIFLSSF